MDEPLWDVAEIEQMDRQLRLLVAQMDIEETLDEDEVQETLDDIRGLAYEYRDELSLDMGVEIPIHDILEFLLDGPDMVVDMKQVWFWSFSKNLFGLYKV